MTFLNTPSFCSLFTLEFEICKNEPEWKYTPAHTGTLRARARVKKSEIRVFVSTVVVFEINICSYYYYCYCFRRSAFRKWRSLNILASAASMSPLVKSVFVGFENFAGKKF